jgi:hypothetical protein
MNSLEAKQLNLPEILSRLGYEPVAIKKGGMEYWYQSPFRAEQEASFHTSFLGGKWIWNDFGDIGGTVIDLILRYKNYTRISDALSFLDQLMQGSVRIRNNSFSFQQQKSAEVKQLEFLEAYPVSNPVIFEYLCAKRMIEKDLVSRYLEEVRYLNKSTGKSYFAFGMKNQSGGYEIRSAMDEYPFKSALLCRDVSLIPGLRPGIGYVHVFEGMTDFLSLLTLMRTDALVNDCIIMHSLSSFDKTIKLIDSQGYDSIKTFLDNNQAGKSCTNRFKEILGDKLRVQSSMFEPYIDINDCLTKRLIA